MSSFTNITDEWSDETIETRIDNEAYSFKINEFNLYKTKRNLDFTGNLSLISAIEIVYSLEESGFNMFRECKTVLELSKKDMLKISFKMTQGREKGIVVDKYLSESITKKEYEDTMSFVNHITLMLEIWKIAIIKKWEDYFDNPL